MKFVFDLDGTICFDGENIPKNIIEVLKKASDYGHEVCFASARSYRDCLPVLKDDFKKNSVIALNGTTFYKNEKLLSYTTLDNYVYNKILNICIKNNLPFFIDDYINYTYNKPEKVSFFKYVDTFKVAKSLKLEEMIEPTKMVIFVEDNIAVRDELLMLAKESGKVEAMYHEIEKSIYINPENINKASSILKNISEEYIAFGNDKNDIEMFKYAIHSVQIGSYSELKQVTDEVISGENIEEMIAIKIEELFKKYK